MTTPEIDATLKINGSTVRARVEARTLLVEFLRRDRSLTGTHVGCDTSQCGACTVLLDGAAVKSCTILVAQAEGRSVRTIEGVADGEKLHPIQQALHECHGLQCGYCTPGIVMTALDLLARDAAPSRAAIREALEGNLCRCTGYHNIVDAIETAARTMRAGRG